MILTRALRQARGRRGQTQARAVAWGWLACLALGIGLAVWASQADRLPGDVDVGRWIQDHDPFGQAAIDFFRDVGSSVAALVTLLLIATFLAWNRRPRMAAAVVALVLALALQTALKEVVDRPRTSVLFLEQRTEFDSPSFPSGHTMSSMIVGSLTVYLAWRLRLPPTPLMRVGRAVVAGWGVVVALMASWVAVGGGVHWPSDVAGGVVWAAVCMGPALALLERGRRLDRRGG